ncbi:MAG TPA: hypothetical protein VHJ78_06970 [Actinomycetota bacterium]|nr:hypothetical protein [Actinomycetota bacterium]
MRNRKLVGVLATAVVVGLVVAGLFAVGSPATARKARIDQERRNRITQLHYLLASHVREEGSLPSDLASVDEEVLRQHGFSQDMRKDPETGEFFEYRRISEREYEVCADFLLSSDEEQAREFGPFPGDVSHEAGRNCYDRTVTEDEVEAAPGIRPPRPEVVRPLPNTLSPSPAETGTPSDGVSPNGRSSP